MPNQLKPQEEHGWPSRSPGVTEFLSFLIMTAGVFAGSIANLKLQVQA